MATYSEEFEPVEHISRLIKFWWVLVLCAALGGAAGLMINRFKAPVYEAQAIFMTIIDFNKIDFTHPPANTPEPYQFSQYDEDLSLALVQTSLIRVEPQVVDFAKQNGLSIDIAGLTETSTVERYHAYWYVRFRDSDPALAQKMVNYWAQAGFADMQAKQKANELPTYILFDLIQLAELPKSPTYLQTNSFVLAGIVIGLIAGILLVNMPFIKNRKDH